MLNFKTFIVEYLTDEQRKRYSNIQMTKKARNSTDHFFGKDNDVIHGIIDHDNVNHPKSEIHKQVEAHLGQEISTENYRSGLIKDKYGRDSKLGKAIKDDKLRNAFASDKSREGSKSNLKHYTTSTHRGVEVAGRTNYARSKTHPSGHSWGNLSCKNVDDGENKHYLKNEIKHGTVVHFVHDQDGKEIYRATLQPHYNGLSSTYSVDAEYGVKHPAFTKSAHETALKLSGEYKPGMFIKHSKVYDDSGQHIMLHPNATPEHISKALDDKDRYVRLAAIKHPNASSENISKALDDISEPIRKAASLHPNASSENISKALDDKDTYIRQAAIKHPNASEEHIKKGLTDKNKFVVTSAEQEAQKRFPHLLKDK